MPQEKHDTIVVNFYWTWFLVKERDKDGKPFLLQRLLEGEQQKYPATDLVSVYAPTKLW